jgi:hypothetical protein
MQCISTVFFSVLLEVPCILLYCSLNDQMPHYHFLLCSRVDSAVSDVPMNASHQRRTSKDAWGQDVSLIASRAITSQLMGCLPCCNGLFLAINAFEQLMERVSELLNALVEQLLGDLFVGDANLL